ncbi:putative monooxygenase [Mycobacterium kansasii]|uniref:Putative monooxygenase n=1 Tax=Mycobacterium kansasii TaxID=1768 RepID=A0A1V3XHV4_MYCKA|nr:putative monooxygenase [Mycobacterium kansasii]
MIQAPDVHHVVVVGAGARGRAALAAAGAGDIVIIDSAANPEAEVLGSVFDDDTDTWAVRTGGGEVVRGRVVIAAHRPPYVPWIPDLPGRDDFGGESFHAAAWDPTFDAAGKRIAAVGIDTALACHLDRLVESADSVTVVAHARAGWSPTCHCRPPGPALAASQAARRTAAAIAQGGQVGDRGADAVGRPHRRRCRVRRRRHHLRHRVRHPRSAARADPGWVAWGDHPTGLAGRHGALPGYRRARLSQLLLHLRPR